MVLVAIQIGPGRLWGWALVKVGLALQLEISPHTS